MPENVKFSISKTVRRVIIGALILLGVTVQANLVVELAGSIYQSNGTVSTNTITGVQVGNVIAVVANGNHAVLTDGFYGYETATRTADIELTYTPAAGIYTLRAENGVMLLDAIGSSRIVDVITKDITYDFDGASYLEVGVFLEAASAGARVAGPIGFAVDINTSSQFIPGDQDFSEIDTTTRTFDLASSDKLAVTGLAFVEAIPEPATLVFIGAFGAIMLFLRRYFSE